MTFLSFDIDKDSPAAAQLVRLANSSGTPIIKAPPDSVYERMREDDRAWFDDNPTRCLRLRYPTAGDRLVLGDKPEPLTMLLVFCPTDGIRLRLPVVNDPTNLFPARFINGDVDLPLAGLATETLNWSRTAWGVQQTRRLVAALAQCIASGGRLRDWDWQ